ncbi:MAG: TonB-dependent receptor [Vicinamibacterales bacterium]
MRRVVIGCAIVAAHLLLAPHTASAQAVTGTVRDETGAILPGVTVEVHGSAPGTAATVTDATGTYRLEAGPGSVEVEFSLVNFATVRRNVNVAASASTRLDVILRYVLSADVTVTGKRTFGNLADADRPAEDLVGIAQSASQGAITARQLDARPIMRSGEVLETVPGVVISQHSGEGKANQYYLRGFNLDHGTDFASTVAGMPVNLPTHGHGQGYSDLNFLIPELVSGVQFQKGPYFAGSGRLRHRGVGQHQLCERARQDHRPRWRRRSGIRQSAVRGITESGPRPSARCARSRAQRWPLGAARRLPED